MRLLSKLLDRLSKLSVKLQMSLSIALDFSQQSVLQSLPPNPEEFWSSQDWDKLKSVFHLLPSIENWTFEEFSDTKTLGQFVDNF